MTPPSAAPPPDPTATGSCQGPYRAHNATGCAQERAVDTK
jgi:hypothetical protein